MKHTVPRGTQDVLPEQWRRRQLILDTARAAFERACFERIATPTFEETALFVRGVGESSDIVRKEMYTFSDRSDRSLTLRPEGTAPVVRAFVNGLQRAPLPVKLWYHAPMFRYEAPQRGRYREHYQFGAETIGSPNPASDAELIALLDSVYRDLGLRDVHLRVNSIGDEQCRPQHREALVAFLEERRDELCEECRERIQTNPLRVFDCKNERCQHVAQSAPTMREYLCEDCNRHFSELLALLDAAGIAHTIDDTLVRGLDYYTRTTFEFTSGGLGSQDAIGGGGRYDRLVAGLGGPDVPAVGFGCGVERLALALEAAGVEPPPSQLDLYICVADEKRRSDLFSLQTTLRAQGLRIEGDVMDRSTKGQLKQASRLGARFALIAEEGTDLRLRAMRGREEWKIDQTAQMSDEIRRRLETQ